MLVQIGARFGHSSLGLSLPRGGLAERHNAAFGTARNLGGPRYCRDVRLCKMRCISTVHPAWEIVGVSLRLPIRQISKMWWVGPLE